MPSDRKTYPTISSRDMEIKLEAYRQRRVWTDRLGAKMEPPPYSPERKSAWRAGYDDALQDVAEMLIRENLGE